MSAHSTLAITREDAKKALMLMAIDAMSGKLDDELLIDLMDALYYKRLNNFVLVPKYEEGPDAIPPFTGYW